MISLQKVGDAIKFTFQDNPLYLNDGTIEVPVNSLSLLIDESDIATFKKSNGDAFLCCSLDELNMTKEQLIAFYKNNMVGDEGMTPEEVEDIVESATTNLFGYAEYDSQNTRINFKHDASGSVISYIDASDFVIDGMIDNVEIVTVQGVKYLKITFNTESGKEPILIPLSDIFNPSDYYTKTEVDNAISAATSGKVDTSAVTEAIAAAVSGKADTSAVTEAITAAVSGKQDTLVSGTNIKTINNTSILGSGNIDIQGGGKEIVAGRGIAITTGETAYTVSFNLPISKGTGTNSIVEGNSSASGQYSHAEGLWTNASANYSHSEGYSTYAQALYSHVEGQYTTANNQSEHASGQFNVSNKANNTFGNSGNTLFSVGNGTSNNAKHNAFEIRQNGDIYIVKDGSDVKLQDQLGGGSSYTAGSGIDITNDVISVTGKVDTTDFNTYSGAVESRLAEDEEVTAAGINAVNDKFGGLSIVKLTQAEYSAMEQAGTLDGSTLYIVIDS